MVDTLIPAPTPDVHIPSLAQQRDVLHQLVQQPIAVRAPGSRRVSELRKVVRQRLHLSE